MKGEHEIFVTGRHFLLSTSRTMYWKAAEALLLADLHIGKAGHLRKHGIAVPSGYMSDDLDRLSAEIAFYKPKRVMILGDLVHAEHNRELLQFEDWLRQYDDITFHVILGNHDRHARQWLQSLPLQVHADSLQIEDCVLMHTPAVCDSGLCIAGHIHPGIAIPSYMKKKIRVPAFLVSETQIILPAFSTFTGLDTNYAEGKNFDAYAITPKKIIPL